MASKKSRRRHADVASRCAHVHTSDVEQIAVMHLLRCRDCGLFLPMGPANDDAEVKLAVPELVVVRIEIHALGERPGLTRCRRRDVAPTAVGPWATHGNLDRVAALEAQLRELAELGETLTRKLGGARVAIVPCPRCIDVTEAALASTRQRLSRYTRLSVRARPDDIEEI